jgi:hypothetical protein
METESKDEEWFCTEGCGRHKLHNMPPVQGLTDTQAAKGKDLARLRKISSSCATRM